MQRDKRTIEYNQSNDSDNETRSPSKRIHEYTAHNLFHVRCLDALGCPESRHQITTSFLQLKSVFVVVQAIAL